MPRKDYDELITTAANAHGLDPVLFRKQLVQESGLNPKAKSKAGALGIGQIMPKYFTGQYGLNTREDFENPEKSINAAAAIMGKHVKTHGSWNAALVAYNAGAGKGRMKAFKEGRISDLPKETQDYLAKLGNQDSSLPAQATQPAPKKQPSGILAKKGELPTVAALSERGTLDTTGKLYQELPTESIGESISSGFRSSPLATAVRSGNPMAYVQGSMGYTFDEEDMETLRGAPIGSAGVRFVMSNAQKKEDIQQLINIAQENRTAATANRTFIGELAFGIGEAAGDPISYASMLLPTGIYSRAAGLFNGAAARVAAGAGAVALEGGLTNLASESLRETSTGTDADYAMALASGAAFSVGMLGVGAAAGAVVRGINRVEASESARVLRDGGVSDVRDPSVMNPGDMDRAMEGWREINPKGNPQGVLLETPTGDTVHPASGLQFSSHNPINPKYDIPEPNLGGNLTLEIGDVLARSSVPEHKNMAFKLFRTSRGYEDGSSGLFGVTAQDVDSTLKGDFSSYQKSYESFRKEAFSDPAYQGVGTLTDQRRLFNERVIKAAETGDMDGLLPAEKKAADLRLTWYQSLADLQKSPGERWGVQTKGLLGDSLQGRYAAPIVYNELKIADFADKFGGADVLQDMVKRSFMKSYMEDPAVKTRVDSYLVSIGSADTPEQLANKVAFGIAGHSEDLLDMGRLNTMMEQASFTGGGTPDFRKARSPFGYHSSIDLPDGSKFSVSDLRSYDADVLDSAYLNRVKGDVAVAVGTGLSPEEFSKFLTEVNGRASIDANLKKEAKAFEKIAGNLYGIGITEGGERLKAALGVLQDLAFMKSSAFMGVLNYSEIASGLMRNGIGFGLRAVPGIGDMFSALRFGKKTAENMRLAQNIVWGSALDRAILPTYREAIDLSRRKLYADSGVNRMNNLLGSLQGSTSAAAGRFWTSRVLNHTSEKIIEAARGEFFADLAAASHGVRKTSFTNEGRFKAASLTSEQMQSVLDLLKSSTKVSPEGELTVTNQGALTRGPAAAALRRYGQYWSERVIQQGALGSTFRWSHLPLIRPLTQFMSFVGKSMNSILIRGNSDIMRNGDVGTALSMYVIGPLISAGMYAATTHIQSAKFTNERDRRKFLEERLGTEDDIGPLVAGAIKRSAMMAIPSYAYDTIGQTPYAQKVAPELFKYAGFGKTSTEAKLRRDAQSQSGAVGGILGDAIEQSPSVKIADSIAGLGKGSVDYLVAEGWTEKEKAAKDLKRAFAGLLPNDPLTQRAWAEFRDTIE